MKALIFLVLICLAAFGCTASAGETPKNLQATPYAQWNNGPGAKADYFPIAVWLQAPKNAAKFKAMGINLYVGLWKGPTAKQLAALTKAGMPVVCAQNAVGLKHINDPIIAAWMHGDEPDNAQAIERAWKSAEDIQKAWPDLPKKTLKQWGKYGPPIPPKTIIADYKGIKANDPSRPVMLNLGQGVANDKYRGRGVRSRKMEDYPEYVKGCDIVSFDIYPVVHSYPDVAGKLEFVPKGVDRLRKWTKDQRIVWNCIECTHISSAKVMPTPQQVRTEVWMSIIRGSRGLIYFVHEWKPKFTEPGVLLYPEMVAGITKVNRRIHSLAAVINSPTLDVATVKTSDEAAPVALMAKKHEGAVYVFAVTMRDRPAEATFTVKGLTGKRTVEVLGEDRKLQAAGGKFIDSFKGYDVHLYRIK